MASEPPPPRSALTLRIVLASFGLCLWIAAAVLAAVYDLPAGWVIAFAVLAVVAAVDLLIVARRKVSENKLRKSS
jgi:membrane protein implicated in regulation of membrane protease activity